MLANVNVGARHGLAPTDKRKKASGKLRAFVSSTAGPLITMQIGVPAESHPLEARVALVPRNVKRILDIGFSVAVESEAGRGSGFSDDDYRDAGAQVTPREQVLASDVVLRVSAPSGDEIHALSAGALQVSFLDPFRQRELVERLAAQGVTSVSMEMVPRTTLAQKMDALSSQASFAGYAAVLFAAERSSKFFPMMMTPGGTIPPARVFVIGAGVAGLQAIATAKRLGARVDAFDTRPEVKEQVESLGGKFVEIDLGETGATEQGYARELTQEQIEMQRKGQAEVIARSDVVITTAQVFGRPAPRIVTAEMVADMKPGSLVIDMAVDSGGNVEGTRANEEVLTTRGAILLGVTHLPSRVAQDASLMYSNNLLNLIEHLARAKDADSEESGAGLGAFWQSPSKDDPIAESAIITGGGKVLNARILAHYAAQDGTASPTQD